MDSIILIGGGGHCSSCIEVIESTQRWGIAGIIDTPDRCGESILGYKVIGSDEDLVELASSYTAALITVGQIRTSGVRQRLYHAALAAGFSMPIILASTARVSSRAELGSGTIVFHAACVNARVSIGENSILNTGAIVEHDVTIGKHCHISTGAIINGGCHIGDACFIGSGAILRNNVTIGNGVVLGAGAVVVCDLLEEGIYVGCPARIIP